MNLSHPRWSNLALIVAVAAPLGRAAPAQAPATPAAPPSPAQVDRPEKPDNTEGVPRLSLHEASERFEPTRKRVAPKLVRVEVVNAMVHRNAAVGFERITETRVGMIPAVLVDPLPILVVAEQLAEPKAPSTLNSATPLKPDDGKAPVASLGTRYFAWLSSGERVKLSIKDRSRPLGLIFLGLDDPADPPAEIRDALLLPPVVRRITASENFAIPVFRDAVGSHQVITVPGRLERGGDSFVRPALVGVPPATIGYPLFSLDGEWLGMVNSTPSGEKHERVRNEKPDVAEITPARDPAEWTFGHRWPILMSVVELEPEISRVRATVSMKQELGVLGLALVDRDGGVFVEPTDSSSSALSIDPPLTAGDKIVLLAGQPVATVLGFERALERVLGQSDAPIELTFERGTERSVATLRFPE